MPAGHVVNLESFSVLCPILSKSNTFQRFDLAELSANGNLGDVADVLTSSGHGGVFSFGVISRMQAAAERAILDRALTPLRHRLRRTLTINCLPMGVCFFPAHDGRDDECPRGHGDRAGPDASHTITNK